MKITAIRSHVLQYDLPEQLGYSQQYYARRSAHLVEVSTDEGITGWGECFGPGNIALANKTIVEGVIAPMVIGMDPLDRDVIWHRVYNLTRDHGQKGMPIQSLSGVDIALWDIAGKIAGLPIHKLIGGAHRDRVSVYGYGMMLRPEPLSDLLPRFEDEAAEIKAKAEAAQRAGITPIICVGESLETREAGEAEIDRAIELVNAAGGGEAAWEDLLFAMINSTEFLTNH